VNKDNKKWLRFTTPESNIKTMALLKAKARSAFVFIKMIFSNAVAAKIRGFVFTTLQLPIIRIKNQSLPLLWSACT
jgi:hypothetical protein